jgi:hypothetical protein
MPVEVKWWRRWLRPSGIIWAMAHVIVFLLGLVFINSAFIGLLSESLSQGIGGSLVAAGIGGEIIFLYVTVSEDWRLRLQMFFDAGLLQIFQRRSVSIRNEYDVRLSTAKEIDVIGYGLGSLRQDYGSHFANWSQRARVRILLIDPDFPTADYSLADIRDTEEGRTRGDTRRDAEAFIALVLNSTGIRKSSFELRKMRAIPVASFLRADDQIFWGPYLINEQSRNSPTLLIQRHGFLFDAMLSHFENLWSDKFSSRVFPHV